MSLSKKLSLEWSFFLSENDRDASITNSVKVASITASKVSEQWWCPPYTIFFTVQKVQKLGLKMGEEIACADFSV